LLLRGSALAFRGRWCALHPVQRAGPFDHADWLFEAKFDGFRAAADTVRGRLISRNGNRMQRFEALLDSPPKGHVFDGELVVLDDAGPPLFNELLFGRRRPSYVAFDGGSRRRSAALPALGAQRDACGDRQTRRGLDCAD
jgi:hypothetical protein